MTATQPTDLQRAAHLTELESLVVQAEQLEAATQALLRRATDEGTLALRDLPELLDVAHHAVTVATWAWGAILERRGLLSEIPRLVGADGKPMHRKEDVPLLQTASTVKAALVLTAQVVAQRRKLGLEIREVHHG